MKLTTDKVIDVFLLICLAFGMSVGFIGLGIGLILLPLVKAFGVAILAMGCGMFFGMTFGANWIMRSFLESLKDVQDGTDESVINK